MSKKVKCPSCHKSVDWSKASPFRPFCSERCRLIDLGEWASEKHAIPGEQVITSEEIPISQDEKNNS